MATEDEEKEAAAEKPKRTSLVEKIGRVRALIIGIGAVAGALTAVFVLIFLLFPGLKPTEPSPKTEATLSISRVEHDVTFGEYLRRPGVQKEGAVESDEQLEMVGNVIYFDVELQGFAEKSAYVRYTVYDADTEKAVNGLSYRRAWPSENLIPSSKTSKAQLETWVPVPQDGSGGPYKIWLELYTLIKGQERRLASDEVTIGR